MQIISVRENPEWTETVISYFQKRWAGENSMMVYDDCIRHCLGAASPLPQWYLLVDGDKIVGGAVMTKEYADAIGADCYAPDAMATVHFAESVFTK